MSMFDIENLHLGVGYPGASSLQVDTDSRNRAPNWSNSCIHNLDTSEHTRPEAPSQKLRDLIAFEFDIHCYVKQLQDTVLAGHCAITGTGNLCAYLRHPCSDEGDPISMGHNDLLCSCLGELHVQGKVRAYHKYTRNSPCPECVLSVWGMARAACWFANQNMTQPGNGVYNGLHGPGQ